MGLGFIECKSSANHRLTIETLSKSEIRNFSPIRQLIGELKLENAIFKSNSQQAPDGWHLFLYRSILLFWEINGKSGITKMPFRSTNNISNVRLIRKKTLDEMKILYKQLDALPPSYEFIAFHSNNSTYPDLFKNLRNCVAHGHYRNIDGKSISFAHEFKNNIKIFGKLRYSSLKKLISVMSV